MKVRKEVENCNKQNEGAAATPQQRHIIALHKTEARRGHLIMDGVGKMYKWKVFFFAIIAGPSS